MAPKTTTIAIVNSVLRIPTRQPPAGRTTLSLSVRCSHHAALA
jgi:hypothetical protein